MTITGNLTTDSEGNILQVGCDVKLILSSSVQRFFETVNSILYWITCALNFTKSMEKIRFVSPFRPVVVLKTTRNWDRFFTRC